MEIDLNADIGESYGRWEIPGQEELMNYVSSVNVACGFHAGDPLHIKRTLQLAVSKSLSIGAHPGLPDLQGFGRRVMAIDPEELEAMVFYQVAALMRMTEALGSRLRHVKPHGALYHMVNKDAELANAFLKALKMLDPQLMIYGMDGSLFLSTATQHGFLTVEEGFADRGYTDNGQLMDRSEPGSVIENPVKAAEQAYHMVVNQQIFTKTEKILPIHIKTICLHGDNDHALTLTRTVYERLVSAGVQLKPYQIGT